MILFRETFSYSEKILLHSEKHFHIQNDFFIFNEIYYIQRNCIFKESFLHSEKDFISIEIVYIQRNVVFYPKKILILKKIGTFRENLKLKFQIIYHSRVSSCIFDIHKKNWSNDWLDSTMVASYERPSERLTVIFFVGLQRIAKELQNIQQKYMITSKERIKKALNGLKHL